jgi:hypothetical protein
LINAICDNNTVSPNAAYRSTVMSEIVDTQRKPNSLHGSTTDRDILAHVEKWLAMIREISREQAKN